MTALYVILGVLAGALAAAGVLWGYFKRRLVTADGDRTDALTAADEATAGRVATETQRNAATEARARAAAAEARHVEDPTVALDRLRAALERLRRP